MDRRVFSNLLLAGIASPRAAWSQVKADGLSSEDARLTAFFRKADDERLELSPEAMTFRGIKRRYSELGDHSRALTERYVAMSSAQVAQMKKEFNPAQLS